MKTIKTYIPVIVLSLLLAATGILKAQPDNHRDDFLNTLFLSEQEEQTAPLPFNTNAIASEALFQKLQNEYFSKEQDKQIAPLPPEVQKMIYQSKLEKAWKLATATEEEPEINDLPPQVKKFMAAYQKTLLVQKR